MRFAGAILAAALLAATAGTGSAGVVDTLVGFDDARNGARTYTSPDGFYFFSPTNFQSSAHCADPVSGAGNGSCLIEVRQGAVTTLTRTDGGLFSLASFYFNLTGEGQARDNFVTVTNDDTGGAVTLQLGKSYANVTLDSGASFTGALARNTGYIVSLLGLGFDDTSSVSWTSHLSGNVRIDDMALSRHDVVPIPLPAGGWLILSGLVGLVWHRGRRSA